MTNAAEITQQALLLPDEARATLAEVLLDSLDGGEDTPEIAAILEQRSRAIREGRANFRHPDEIFEVYEQMKAARRSAQAS